MTVVKIKEFIGTSEKGWEDAIKNVIEEVKEEGKITGIDVLGLKAAVRDNKIVEYRANVKVALIKE